MTKTEIHLIRLGRRQILRYSVKPAGILHGLLFVRDFDCWHFMCYKYGGVQNISDINTRIILFCGGFYDDEAISFLQISLKAS